MADRTPVAFSIRDKDGRLSSLGWMAYLYFDSATRMFELDDGAYYVFAYEEEL